MHAATFAELPPIPRHLRDLLPVNPRVRRLLEDPAPPRDIGPPRSPREISARLRELVTRREALTKRHEERVAGEAQRQRELDAPPTPRPPRQSRVSEVRGGAGWLADRGEDWLEIAREDLAAMGDIPERETPRLGRPRKTRVAPDLAAALARIAGVDAPAARHGYGESKSDGGVQTPSTAAPSVPVFSPSVPEDRPDAVAGARTTAFVNPPSLVLASPQEDSGDPTDTVAAAESTVFHVVGAPCAGNPVLTNGRSDGRACDPVQLALPLPPWALARHIEPDIPARRHRGVSFDAASRANLASPARAGPEWLPGFEDMQANA